MTLANLNKTPAQILALIDRARADLTECTDNIGRMHVRDQAERLRVLGEITNRSDIADIASKLIARAERAIYEATPKTPGSETSCARHKRRTHRRNQTRKQRARPCSV